MSVANWGEKGIIAIVHPMWAIDEKAKSFRIWVWFSPPQPPTKAAKNPAVTISQVGIDSCIVIRI